MRTWTARVPSKSHRHKCGAAQPQTKRTRPFKRWGHRVAKPQSTEVPRRSPISMEKTEPRISRIPRILRKSFLRSVKSVQSVVQKCGAKYAAHVDLQPLPSKEIASCRDLPAGPFDAIIISDGSFARLEPIPAKYENADQIAYRRPGGPPDAVLHLRLRHHRLCPTGRSVDAV